jgi:4-amino-4-deoxy-L-arabinose transferase-like glycosyltransferase
MKKLFLATFAFAALVLLLAFVLRNPTSYTIDVGDVGDTRVAGGFFTPEVGEGATFRWSGPSSRLVLHGASAGPQTLLMRLSGERLAALEQPELRIEHAAAPTTRFEVRPGWRVYRVLLPPETAATIWGSALPLELRSAFDRPGSDAGDERRIGVPLDRVGLVPLGGRSPFEPLARGLMLAWLLAVIVGGYGWIEAQLVPRLRSTSWQRMALLFVLGSVVLLLAAWRVPFLLAYLLPPMPWILGLASLVLLIQYLTGFTFGFNNDQAVLHRGQLPGREFLDGPAGRVCGLGLLVVANGLLNTRVAVGLGIGLALIGLFLLLRGGLGQQTWGGDHGDLSRRTALIGLALIVFVAFAMRLFRIEELPFGLWRDEARHGLFALRMVDDPSYRPVYIASERVNMPALGLYPFALALGLGGVEIHTMRLVTAVAGALTVLPLYGLVWQLCGRRDLALASAALLAIASWHITISRFSFPTIFDPLLTLTGLWLLCIGLGVGRAQEAGGRRQEAGGRLPNVVLPKSLGFLVPVSCLFAGMMLGLAVQTYHTGRIAPVVGVILALLLLFQQPQAWRHWLIGVAMTVIGFGLVIWPLALYALTQPEAFNDRVGDVFLLSEKTLRGLSPLSMLDEAARRHLLMFNVQGDINGRHHAPFRPLLDYVTGIGFLAGAAAILRRLSDWRSLFVLAALGLGLAPSALAVDAPHAMRSLDACAFACIIAAVGWREALRICLPQSTQRAQSSQQQAGFVRTLWALCPLWLIMIAFSLNAAIYFVLMPPDREVWQVFYPVQSQIGAYVRGIAAEEGSAALDQVFVTADLSDDPVYTFLVHGLPVQSFAGTATSKPVQPGARFLVGGYFYRRDGAALAPLLGSDPQPTFLGPPFPDGSGPSFAVYEAR